MTEPINLDDYDAPDKPDFKRMGRWGSPGIIHPESGKRVIYGRASNAGKILDDESNLTDWKIRTVVAGAAQRPELMAQASVLDIDTDKRALREIGELCLVAGKGQRRAIIGTAIHSMFDLIDRNTGWQPPENYLELCAAYADAKLVWGLVPEDIEVQCVSDEHGKAGTLDRRYRITRTMVAPDGSVIPIGSLIVADIKTGKELEYAAGSYATQLAAYVDSVRYNVVTDERTPFYPQSVKDWGLIIHADSSGERVDIYWVDIEAGRRGIKLAKEVSEWRRADGLLTLANRIVVTNINVATPDDNYADQQIEADQMLAASELPAPAPTVPAEVATTPVEASRVASRREYLAGRVRAILAHSDVAAKALQISWPTGIPGLKNEGHSMDSLDAIMGAVELVETNHSVPFYPPWDDPEIEESILSHPSNVWAKGETPTIEDKEVIGRHILDHPRSNLARQWITAGISGGINSEFDTAALAHALTEFLNLDATEWPDKDLTVMLDGSLRALGYQRGVSDLGQFNPEHAPLLMSAAFAITAGNAYLVFDENENPIVRTNVRKG